MSDYPQLFKEAVVKETKKRMMEESIPRLKKCLDQLSEAEIWHRPNEHSNSVGNLVLHLCGNVRQWILSGLGKQEDIRERQQEFDEQGPVPKEILLDRLDKLMAEVDECLQELDPKALLEKHPVQVYQESGLGILLHVVEHFSYHVGQIVYVVKATRDMDMGFYAGINLDGKGGE